MLGKTYHPIELSLGFSYRMSPIAKDGDHQDSELFVQDYAIAFHLLENGYGARLLPGKVKVVASPQVVRSEWTDWKELH